jgi:hypothetical protein
LKLILAEIDLANLSHEWIQDQVNARASKLVVPSAVLQSSQLAARHLERLRHSFVDAPPDARWQEA